MDYATETEVADAAKHLRSLSSGLNQVLFGQEELIDLVITGVLARGHILLEGLPGLGKTELVKGLSKLLHLGTKRVQFTPDLLPGDITGNPVLQEVDGRREFVFQPGPLFTNIVLADEINRASPKTQSALLEAMQERRVTVLGKTHDLPKPFFVLATQNPIELEGTYPLPEAQLDRFLFKLEVTRNDVATLQRIVSQRELGTEPQVDPVMTADTFNSVRTHPPDLPAGRGGELHRPPGGRHPPRPIGRRRASATAQARAPPWPGLRRQGPRPDARAHPRQLRGCQSHRPRRAPPPDRARLQRPRRRIRDLLEEVPFQSTATPKVLAPKA
jgi:MoxR-like ATPase